MPTFITTCRSAELVAVCDLNEARARDIADRYNVPHVYTDYRDLLARPDIAAVSIATPDFVHREIAVAAAEAGKHILVEKPLATTVEDAEAILRAADDAGVKLMVDFHNRVNPAFVTTRGKRFSTANSANSNTSTPVSAIRHSCRLRCCPWADQSSALWFLASHMLDISCWLLARQANASLCRQPLRHPAEAMGINTQPISTSPSSSSSAAPSSHWRTVGSCPRPSPMSFNLKVELLGSDGAIYINTSDHRTVEKFTRAAASLPDTLGFTLDANSARLSGFVLEAIARFVDAVVDDAARARHRR